MSPQPHPERTHGGELIHLDRPSADGALAQTLKRRSTKSFRPDHIDSGVLSRLLATTISTGPSRSRPYGSAHGRYDVLVTVVTAAVRGLPAAVYRYLSAEHALLRCSEEGDHRAELAHATLDAAWLTQCPAVLILSSDLAAANRAFDAQQAGRGERFCWLEAGLLTQNIHLWVAANGLGTAFLGGLDPTKTQAATARWLPSSHSVLGILPIGHPTRTASTP